MQPGGCVDDVSKGSEVLDFLFAVVTDVGYSEVGAGPGLETDGSGLLEQLDPGLDHLPDGVLPDEQRDEETDHLVSHEFVDDRVLRISTSRAAR